MRNIDGTTITPAFLQRLNDCADPRLKEILSSLVTHLHGFAREVKLTEAEWMQGIQFLTHTGQKCSDTRQEFILLSDTLGLSMLVVALNQAKPPGATEATHRARHCS
jgi:hydroxyquinol 1,2-dioxygenase